MSTSEKSCIFVAVSATLLFPVEATRLERYRIILDQWQHVWDDEADTVANLSNITSVLMEAFGFHWIGFYRVVAHGESVQLMVGPFQGPSACTRIGWGKGVCGTAWKEARTVVVPDVDLFPGHIACSSLSRSEIVVPIIVKEKVVAVLDIDSTVENDFHEEDRLSLEQLMKGIAEKW